MIVKVVVVVKFRLELRGLELKEGAEQEMRMTFVAFAQTTSKRFPNHSFDSISSITLQSSIIIDKLHLWSTSNTRPYSTRCLSNHYRPSPSHKYATRLNRRATSSADSNTNSSHRTASARTFSNANDSTSTTVTGPAHQKA